MVWCGVESRKKVGKVPPLLYTIETVLTKYEDDVIGSPTSQCMSRRRKPGGGESPPGCTRSLHNLSGAQTGPCSSWVVFSPSDQQDLDHYDEVLIFYNINPTVSPPSLIKLEQAWSRRLVFKEGRYSTRPDWEYLATVARAASGEVGSLPSRCPGISVSLIYNLLTSDCNLRNSNLRFVLRNLRENAH